MSASPLTIPFIRVHSTYRPIHIFSFALSLFVNYTYCKSRSYMKSHPLSTLYYFLISLLNMYTLLIKCLILSVFAFRNSPKPYLLNCNSVALKLTLLWHFALASATCVLLGVLNHFSTRDVVTNFWNIFMLTQCPPSVFDSNAFSIVPLMCFVQILYIYFMRSLGGL